MSDVVERLAEKHNTEWTGGGALTLEASARQARWWMRAIAEELRADAGADPKTYGPMSKRHAARWLEEAADTQEVGR